MESLVCEPRARGAGVGGVQEKGSVEEKEEEGEVVRWYDNEGKRKTKTSARK